MCGSIEPQDTAIAGPSSLRVKLEGLLEIKDVVGNLLEQVREAEGLAAAGDTQSDEFLWLLVLIAQTATVARERARITGPETPFEGCLTAVLSNLNGVEFPETDWSNRLQRNRQAIERVLKLETLQTSYAGRGWR
jgi:hypothetical protein